MYKAIEMSILNIVLRIFSFLLIFNILSAGGERAILPDEYQKMLRVGMDVDWAKTKKGRVAAQKSHDMGINVPALFKKRGFDHVRIRIYGDVLKNQSYPYTGKRLIDEITLLVDDCLEAGIIPILAYRLDGLKNDPDNDSVMEHDVRWWQAVAKRFRNYPYTLSYDLVIEPGKKLKQHNDRLNLFYQRAVEAIHKIDPKRIVILAPNKLSNPYELKNLQIPRPSRYIMAEWHFYAAGPRPDHPKKQWTTGTPQEKRLVYDKIEAAMKWSRDTRIPTWVGAWMPANYNDKKTRLKKAPDGSPAGGDYTMSQQIDFASYMSAALQKAGIPFAINSDTKYFDRDTNRWYPDKKRLLDVILKRY